MNKKDDLAINELKKAMIMLTNGIYAEIVHIEGCSEELSELVMLFNIISDNVKELYKFSTELAAGNLNAGSPKKNNFMAAGLKEFRSRLNHLTWQAQQVAKGDYSQQVDFMGEFSIAFNSMSERLMERESKLKEEIEERKKVEKQLEYYAFTDSMTEVSNRRTGLLMLEKEIAKSKRSGLVLCICFIDIDGLKIVNDVYGHNEGDYLIITISRTIKEMIRDIDTLSRIGGDEFLIILPECCMDLAQNVMDRIFERMKKINESGEKPYKFDFSYGIEEISGDMITIMDDVIKNADEKMYKNKMYKRYKERN